MGISRFPLGSPEIKCHLDIGLVANHRVYYKGKGGGFLQVRVVVSFVSPILPVAHLHTPKLLGRFKMSLNRGKVRSSGHTPWLSALFRGRGACWSSEMGLGKLTINFTHSCKPTQNQQTSWLAQGRSTFGARMSYGQPQTHKTHHDPDSGEATTFPHIVYSITPHGSCI